MKIIIPKSIETALQDLLMEDISAPEKHKSTDGKFTLAIQGNRLILKTIDATPELFSVIVLDEITESSFKQAILKCYVYADVDLAYRVSLDVRKADPADAMKSILQHTIWVGREDDRAWVGFTVQEYGAVKFFLTKIE